MKTVAELADNVEFLTWASDKPTTSSALKEDLEAILSDGDEQDSEALSQNVIDELLCRQRLLGDAYPFDCDGYKLSINHTAPENTTYLFCLALSLLPANLIGNEQRTTQFETIVTNAAMQFFGGRGMRIGAPWQTPETPTYEALLDRVIDLIPNLQGKNRTTAIGGGDAGWDVIVVKHFSDNLFPRLIALGNCATGRQDWISKGYETQPALFWNFFTHQHNSAELTLFVVPFTMDETARLRKTTRSSLTFDRFRICEFAPSAIPEAASWLEGQRAEALNTALT